MRPALMLSSSQRLLLCGMISAGALFSQIPTGTEAHLVYESSGILYGQSSLSTSAMQIPPGAITHTITASFSLGVKGGSQTTFTKVESGTPDLSYDPVATGNISEIGDDIYDQDMDDSAVCTSYGTFFSDTSPILFVDPPEIAGLGYLNAIANTYGTFAPFVDTPSGAEMYLVIYGYNLPIDGVSTGPPQICINGACGTGTSVTDTGFTLGVPWVVTPPDDTGYGQINIPYSVTSLATAGGYTLALQTNGGGTSSSFTVAPAPSIQVTRSSLLQATATGTPSGFGTFSWVPADFDNWAFASGNSSSSNPNTVVFSNGPNTAPNGAPTPGAIGATTAYYTAVSDSSDWVGASFHVPTFGMSCYYVTTQQQWGAAPSSCSSQTLNGNVYSGYWTNPPGLPAGQYCNAYLVEVALQGSGQNSSGTLVHSVSGGYPPGSIFQIISQLTGSDGTPVIPNGSVARDRSIIPRGGVLVDANGIGSGLLANDTGDGIVGYRLDFYEGIGVGVCANFNNIMAISGCNPGNTNCPSDTAVQ